MLTTGNASILDLIVLDNTQTLSDALNFRDDFFLHQVEAHGEEGDAEEQVERTEGDRLLGILLLALFEF